MKIAYVRTNELHEKWGNFTTLNAYINTNERIKAYELNKRRKRQTNRKNTQEWNDKVRLKMGAEIEQDDSWVNKNSGSYTKQTTS